MNTSLFTDNKLNDLLGKLSYENNKKIYLTGNFNFDLLKISSNTDTSNFYEKVTSNFLFPIITLTRKINEKNNTLISIYLLINLDYLKTIYPKNIIYILEI